MWWHYTTPRWSAQCQDNWDLRKRPEVELWSIFGTPATQDPRDGERTALIVFVCQRRVVLGDHACDLLVLLLWRFHSGMSLGLGQCHWHRLCDKLCIWYRNIFGHWRNSSYNIETYLSHGINSLYCIYLHFIKIVEEYLGKQSKIVAFNINDFF